MNFRLVLRMSDELRQNKQNNTLAFALRSMMFVPYTHVVIRRRGPDRVMVSIGGGDPVSVIRRFGDLQVEQSLITYEGILQIIVK